MKSERAAQDVLTACKPRKEVLEGELGDAIFAADFGQLIDGSAPKVYGHAETFFRNTEPTPDLKGACTAVFRALADKKEAGQLIRLSTGFGGGKTHTLMALWHLAQNITNLSLGTELLPAAGRPKTVKVLAVDADIEAPSLDVVFGSTARTPASTLFGLATPDTKIQPQTVVTPRTTGGLVDLVPCRPGSTGYDLDFAAFALRASHDVVLLEEIAKRLLEYARLQKYDVLLFDHRSGIAASILPFVGSCPGPVAICLRLDDQSTSVGSFFDVLLRRNAAYPGVFVSFSLDPEDSRERMLFRHASRIESLLTRRLPGIEDISKDNAMALFKIREMVGLPTKKEKPARKRKVAAPIVSGKLTGSGATDEGHFIETETLRVLSSSNSPFTYIFGRKGTGKTRLLRELASRDLGEPLVVAADFKDHAGLRSGDALFKDLAAVFSKSPENLWWTILAAGLKTESPQSAKSFEASLRSLENRARKHGLREDDLDKAHAAARRLFNDEIAVIDPMAGGGSIGFRI